MVAGENRKDRRTCKFAGIPTSSGGPYLDRFGALSSQILNNVLFHPTTPHSLPTQSSIWSKQSFLVLQVSLHSYTISVRPGASQEGENASGMHRDAGRDADPGGFSHPSRPRHQAESASLFHFCSRSTRMSPRHVFSFRSGPRDLATAESIASSVSSPSTTSSRLPVSPPISRTSRLRQRSRATCLKMKTLWRRL